MKAATLLISLLIFLKVQAISVTSKELTPKEIIDRMQAIYERMTNISADFEQIYINKYQVAGQKYTGKVFFMKPGKMKWLYEKKERKEIISNGKTLWLFKPDEKQVVVTSNFDKHQVAGISFLWGEGKLASTFNFDLKLFDREKKKYLIELKSKEKQDYYDKLIFSIDADTFRVSQIQIHENTGNINQIQFSSLKEANTFPRDFFEFRQEKDIKIITAPSIQLEK